MKTHLKKGLVIVLLFTLLVPGAFYLEKLSAPEVEAQSFAQGVGVCVGVSYLLSLVPVVGTRVPIDNMPEWLKEQLLDCIVYQLKNEIIEDMTDTTLGYVATGNNGNPIFVNNLEQFYTDTINAVTGSFLQEDLQFLCSPFRAQIQIALTQQFQDYRQQLPRFQCTLTDVVDNIDDFINGNFRAGGWKGWFALTQAPQNNPYGAYILASDELTRRVAAATGLEQEELNRGAGFLSKRKCETVELERTITRDENGELVFSGGSETVCKTITPGSVVVEQLNNVLPVGLQNLVEADEVNEIITLYLGYLISDILTSDEGLAGYDAENFDHELPDVEIPDLPGPGGPTTPSDSEPPGPPGPSTCFVANGTFLEPTPTSAEGYFNLPLPQNTSYDRIELDLDITHGGWHENIDSPRYNTFWFVRDRNRNMFGYVPVQGPSANNVVLRHGIGQVHGSKVKKSANVSLQPGETYHFNYIYDVVENIVDLRITNEDTGNQVARLVSEPDVPGINVGDEEFLIAFSFPYPNQEGNPIEVPSLGWEYKDMRVSFLSEGDSPGSCQTPTFSGGSGGVGSEPPNPGGGIPPRPPLDQEPQ